MTQYKKREAFEDVYACKFGDVTDAVRKSLNYLEHLGTWEEAWQAAKADSAEEVKRFQHGNLIPVLMTKDEAEFRGRIEDLKQQIATLTTQLDEARKVGENDRQWIKNPDWDKPYIRPMQDWWWLEWKIQSQRRHLSKLQGEYDVLKATQTPFPTSLVAKGLSEDTLYKILLPLVEQQSGGEWDNQIIEKDARVFARELLAAGVIKQGE